ncbi:TM2 domain-containing protein [Luteirhabdus pelagi]|uniref:TM2 domain-containing protein n=1 Tax=Luteirhabdus pelagi TaxID=2792783 RepID=UPI00193A3FAE
MQDNTNEGYDSTKKRMDDTSDSFEKEAKSTANEFKEGWNQATHGGENKKILAGILAIVLGALGVHKFILGYNKEGIILLVVTLIGIVTSCFFVGVFLYMATGIIGLIEGIIYLTKSDEEFYQTYQVGQKPWF